MCRHFDVTVIGGGIVGLATAMRVAAVHPELRLAVVEKESQVACHQTGHNSGVIHSGIYYRPGSLKAKFCVTGAGSLVAFCRQHRIPHEMCGKVIVATEPHELPTLEALFQRGAANGLSGLRFLEPEEVHTLEPHAACLKGLQVPTTGIVDFRRVAQRFAEVFTEAGGRLLLDHRLLGINADSAPMRLDTNRGALFTHTMINCAGLYADHVARMAGISPPCQIVPFRGEYYQLHPERNHLVNHLIYPVPDTRFPFLGVHLTRMIDGKREVGPNAVLAWAREGYSKTDVNVGELMETLRYKGFRQLACRYWKSAWHELLRSFSRERFACALQRMVPEIREEDLVSGGAGVRAQALGKDGALLDDFVVLQRGRMLHLLNAPSPAATSSLAIADYIVSISSPLLKKR